MRKLPLRLGRVGARDGVLVVVKEEDLIASVLECLDGSQNEIARQRRDASLRRVLGLA